MEVVRFGSVPEFLSRAGAFLGAHEAEHNLIFGICSAIEADPTQYEGPPYLGAVLDAERVVGAAIRTPPFRVVLSLVERPAAIEALVDDLRAEALPGAVGPAESARAFATAWGRMQDIEPRLVRHERAFRLTKIVPPRATSGEMVRAQPGDRAVVRDWIEAFMVEALPDQPHQDLDALADRWIRGVGRTVYLWVDGGRPVSLAGVGGPTPHGIRVGPVYTPPGSRGRGYASNLVAEVSQAQLDAGRRYVFLFTDLANPTSNKIYQDIGYEPVNDVDEFDFT